MGLLLCLMSSPAFGTGCCVVPFDDEIVKSGTGGFEVSRTRSADFAHKKGVSVPSTGRV